MRSMRWMGLLLGLAGCKPDSGLIVVKVSEDDTGSGTPGGTTVPDETGSPQENAAPELGVALLPVPVFTHDTLTAQVAASDPDGDALAFTYTWAVNGVPAASTTDTLDGAAFERDDLVEVLVEVSDGQVSTAETAATRVSNTPPTEPTVTVSPDAPLSTEDLLCAVHTPSTDADDDPISYVARWTVDGVDHPGATRTVLPGDTISHADTAEGEVWTCSLTPSDGTDDGPAGTASVTIGDDGSVSILVLSGEDSSGNRHVADSELLADFISHTGAAPSITHDTVAPDSLAAYGDHDIVIVSEDDDGTAASVLGDTFDSTAAQAMIDFWQAGGHVYVARERGTEALRDELYWTLTGSSDHWSGMTTAASTAVINANAGTLFEGSTRAFLETTGDSSDLGNPTVLAPFVSAFTLPIHTPVVSLVVYVCAADGSGLLVIDGDRGTPWYSAPSESVDPASGTFGPAVGDVMAGGSTWSLLADCADSDGDGRSNGLEGYTADTDGDGTPDWLDRD